MSEEIRVFNGKFVEALEKRCSELLPHYDRVMARLKDAKDRAKEDVWMLGILRELEEEISREHSLKLECTVILLKR